MNRRTRTALIGGVLIAALLLMGAGFPKKDATPKAWANGVCTAVNSWVQSTQSGAADLSTQLTGTNPNLHDVRDALAGYLGDTAHATTRAIDDLKAAGKPATPKGSKAASTLTDGFKQIRSSLKKLQSEAKDISTKKKAKALKQIKAINKDVNVEFASFQKALSKLQKLDPNHKLEKAFKASQACQAL
jgi:hypothetical protein